MKFSNTDKYSQSLFHFVFHISSKNCYRIAS